MAKKQIEENNEFRLELKKRNLSIRVSEEVEKEWETYRKKHKFSSLSSFVRYCVNTIIERNSSDNQRTEEIYELKKKINEMEQENIKANKETRNILKEIVLNLSGNTSSNDKLLKEYQKKIMLNNLRKNGKTINELTEDLSISEYMVYTLINELLKENQIIEDEDRYKVIY